MGRSILLLAALWALAADAGAYCVYNGLRERNVVLLQEEHPERSREERKLTRTLKPGQSACCDFFNLDCNPSGREEGVVNLSVSIAEEPDVKCGLPGGKFREHVVSVTGTGSLRVMPNVRKNAQAVPYVVRARARDGKDLSGPAGIACRKPTKDNP
jgi:hypothetical protein